MPDSKTILCPNHENHCPSNCPSCTEKAGLLGFTKQDAFFQEDIPDEFMHLIAVELQTSGGKAFLQVGKGKFRQFI